MEIFVTSIIAFASTNLDDIFILTLFYGNRRFRDSEIVTGQFLGITALIAISIIGSLAGLIIEQAYIGLLGFIPVYLGIKSLWNLRRGSNDNAGEKEDAGKGGGRNKFLTVAGVTVANGGDNIGIYIPLFASLSWFEKGTMVSIFLVMTFFWCMLGKYFARHPYVARAVDRYGHMITPFVLILLGIYILYENETLRLLANYL